MMRVLHIHEKPVAGMPWRHAVTCRLAGVQGTERVQLNPTSSVRMGFPVGISGTMLDKLLPECDVVHLHQLNALDMVRNILDQYEKPAVLTIHGDPDRHTRDDLPAYVKRVHVVTPDLLRWWPRAMYVPNFAVCAVVDQRGPSWNQRTVLKPTGHTDKSLREFGALRRGLEAPTCGGPSAWRVVTSTKSPGSVCNVSILASCAHAHFVWDHLNGYVGLTSIEAMARGALAIVHEDALPPVFGYFGAEVPGLVGVTADAVVDILRSFDSESWSERREASVAFMRDVWTAERCMKDIGDLYRGALA